MTYDSPQVNLNLPSYQPTVPLDLLIKAGMMRQGEYDTNQAALQAPIDQLGKYPIIKASDRDIIGQKMNDLVNNTNQYSSQDLGDPRVFNKIVGMQAGVTGDSDLTNRIQANQNAVTQLKKIQTTKDDSPDQYSPDNEHVFNKQLNAWMSDPNKTSFNASYTPYYDYSKEYDKIFTQVKADPDVRNGVAHNPDGSTRPYTQQEIEQVTTAKLKLALQSTLSEKAMGQLGIEYQASMDRPEYSLASTLGELDNHINFLGSNIEAMKTALPNIKDKGTYKEAQALIAEHQDALQAYQEKRNSIALSGDPTEYHTYGKFMDDKMNNIANAYAYRKEGKVSYNELFMEDYKQKNRFAFAKFKAGLQKELMTEPGAVNTTEEGYKSMAVNGEAEFKPTDVYAMQNFQGKMQADGSMDVPLGDKEQVLDLKPTLEGLGMKVTEQQALGVGKILDQYNKWVQTPAGQTLVQKGQTYDASETGAGVTTHSKDKYAPKTIEEWRATLTPDQISKEQTRSGINLSDPGSISAAKALAHNPKVVEAIRSASTILQNNAARGIVNVVPQPGTNTIVASDGSVHNKFFTQMSSTDLTHMGEWTNDMIKSGIFKPVTTLNHDADTKANTKGTQMYQIPIILRSTRPEHEIMADIINRDPIMKQHPGTYMAHAANTMQLRSFVKQSYQGDVDPTKTDPEVLRSQAVKAVVNLVTTKQLTPLQAQGFLGAGLDGRGGKIGEHIQAMEGGDNDTKLKNAGYIKAILSAQNAQDLLGKIKNVTDWTAPLNVTTKPTNNAYIDNEE